MSSAVRQSRRDVCFDNRDGLAVDVEYFASGVATNCGDHVFPVLKGYIAHVRGGVGDVRLEGVSKLGKVLVDLLCAEDGSLLHEGLGADQGSASVDTGLPILVVW